MKVFYTSRAAVFRYREWLRVLYIRLQHPGKSSRPLFRRFPHDNSPYTIFSIKLLYNNLTTLCLNGTLSCVDFMDVIMGDAAAASHPYRRPPAVLGPAGLRSRACYIESLCWEQMS